MDRTKIPKTKVTVLVPVFNTMEYLIASIDSILSQTYREIDIIIIDDHSTDGSYEYLKSIKDKRIRLYRNEQNLGIDGTLNKGLSLSNAQYIVRHDSDDISYPQRIAKQIEYLDKHSTIQVLGTKSMIIKHGKKTTEYPIHAKGLFTLFSCPVHHPTTVYRTDLIYKYDLKYSSVAEDYNFWNHIYCRNNYHRDTFVTLDEVLVHYMVRNNQHTQKNKDQLVRYKAIHQNLWVEKYLHNHGWNIALPTQWGIDDYNRFMQAWKNWEKPSGYSQQEYDQFIKYFAWNILFYQTKKKGMLSTLTSYLKYGNYDIIGVARLLKQGIVSAFNLPHKYL